MTQKDRRIERTQQAINDAFGKLLKEKPFEKISVNDISDLANINRSTFYLHYLDKYNLFDKYFEEVMTQFCRYTDTISGMTSSSALKEYLQLIFVCFEDNFEFFECMYRSENAAFFSAKIRNVVTNILQNDFLRRSENIYQDVEFNIQLRASALTGIIEWWIKKKMPIPPEEIASNILGFFVQLDSIRFFEK